MTKLSDEDLLFLCNLTHIREECVLSKKGVLYKPFYEIWTEENARKKKNIGELIANINVEEFRFNESISNFKFDGEILGSEWADMIEAMKDNEAICNLTLQDIKLDDLDLMCAYFTDLLGNAYVVFRGTCSGEWEDNFAAAYVADTNYQMLALDYINRIDARNITVFGHSKGGNKAKYVALLSDKVSRCVSFDGQGFSQFFIEKYSDLIKKNSYKINCYAVDGDFVNIFLYDIYQNKYYIKGHCTGNSFLRNHSPNTFYSFIYDKNYHVVNYEFKKTNQCECMSKLHSFNNYMSKDISEQYREDLYSYLGKISAMLLGKKPPSYTENYTIEEIMCYITHEENEEILGILIAYFVNYENYDAGITKALMEILQEMNMKDIAKWMKKIKKFIGKSNVLEYILRKYKKVSTLIRLFGAPKYIVILFRKCAVCYLKQKDKIGEVTRQKLEEYKSIENNKIQEFIQTPRSNRRKMQQIFSKNEEVINEYKKIMNAEVKKLNHINRKLMEL